MKYDEMFEKIKKLKLDTIMSVGKVGETQLYILRPSTLSKRLIYYFSKLIK